METNKMKISSEPRDRLSELHDSLILSIFEFLPMNDVVGTQILSKRWKKLWTLTPYLNFDNKFANIDEFRNFVNHCLSRWRGKRIQKLKIWSETFDKSIFSDMDSWVLFAVDHGVQELDTSFATLGFDPYEDDYRVPKCLYSCPSLQKLSCYGSMMELNGNAVQLNRLKSFSITCYGITQHAIDLVLSSPVLEVFSLSFVDKDNSSSLSFRSTSLKVLLIRKSCDNVGDDTELRIWTPNLDKLSISGDSYGKCLLMDVSSLTSATLLFERIDHLGATLSQILPAISHVKELTLSDCCIQALGSINILLPPWSSVTFSNPNRRFEEHERIVGLVHMCPELKTLVLQGHDSRFIAYQVTKFHFYHFSRSYWLFLNRM